METKVDSTAATDESNAAPFVAASEVEIPEGAKVNDPTVPPEFRKNGMTEEPPFVDDEPKRGPGRPPLTDEEKRQRAEEREARRTMGHLFEETDGEQPKPGEEAGAEPGANGSGTDQPTGTAERIPKKGKRADLEALGEIIALNTYGLAGMLFDRIEANPLCRDETGKLCNPDGEAMHLRMKLAWAEYLRSKGSDGVSPGMALLLVNGGYLTQTISQPRSNARLRRYVEKSVAWFKKKFGKK